MAGGRAAANHDRDSYTVAQSRLRNSTLNPDGLIGNVINFSTNALNTTLPRPLLAIGITDPPVTHAVLFIAN